MTKLKGVRKRGNSFMMDCTIDGVRKTKTFKSMEDAISFKSKYKNAVEQKGDVASLERELAKGTWTLLEAFNATFEDYWKNKPSEKWAVLNAGYGIKFFGEKCKVIDITGERLKDYKRHLETTTSNAPVTIDKKLNCVSKMLATAVEYGKLHKKPSFKKLLSKLSKNQKRRKAFLTTEEEREFLDRILVHALEEKNGKWKMFHDFVIFLIDSGARTYGEGMYLPASDVQFAKKKNEMDSVLFWETKTGEPRSVPMTPRVKNILKKRVADAKNNRVWHWLTKDSVRHYWDTIRAEMGWADSKDHCPYICRHTACSRLVQRGVNLPIVMQFMGHSQWETTLGYLHLAPSHLNVCAEALAQGADYADENVVPITATNKNA